LPSRNKGNQRTAEGGAEQRGEGRGPRVPMRRDPSARSPRLLWGASQAVARGAEILLPGREEKEHCQPLRACELSVAEQRKRQRSMGKGAEHARVSVQPARVCPDRVPSPASCRAALCVCLPRPSARRRCQETRSCDALTAISLCQ
jgi:hypothetical protein